MKSVAYPFPVRHQDHGQAVPAREEAAQVHRPCTAVGVIGVDVADHVVREIDQRHDMAAGVE
ncbi:MAG TPA: hypothetical protein VMG10_31160 [Gemmataceae bacterium]|nr:hypothetical protein [Gemmataceae bacterium]